MSKLLTTFTLCASLALAGCASVVSPYGGESSFSCTTKFMEGVPCDSITGTATKYEEGALKWQQKGGARNAPTSIAQMQATASQPAIAGPIQEGRSSSSQLEKQSPRQMAAISTGFPLRTPDRVLRIWIAPFEDEDGALNDQKYVYLTVQKGSWRMESSRKAIQVPYKQIYPLGKNREERQDPDAGVNRANSRNQAQAAVISNPNLNNLPSPQPTDQE